MFPLFFSVNPKKRLWVPIDFPFRNVLINIVAYKPLKKHAQVKTGLYNADQRVSGLLPSRGQNEDPVGPAPHDC